MKQTLILVIIFFVAGLVHGRFAYTYADTASFDTETPRRSEEFLNSIGVTTHISYFDTSYGDISLLARELKLLGVRHVREGAVLQNSDYNKRLYDSWRSLSAFGVYFDVCFDPRVSFKRVEPDSLKRVIDLAGDSVESVEGPNELDVSGLPNWATIARTYQQDLTSAALALTSKPHISVIGPSMAFVSNGKAVGSLSALVTYGNLHSYAAGNPPEGMLPSQIAQAAGIYPNKPLIITETGYHNALEGENPQPGVSEAAASKYIPRLFLETFNAGIARTYLYEFEDEWPDPTGSKQEQHWGLLRNDGSEKAAFVALRNLIGILDQDPRKNFERLSLITYKISSSAFLRHTLLQGAPNCYYLLLWMEVPSFDTKTRKDIRVEGETVAISFGKPHQLISVYDTLMGTEPMSLIRSQQSLSIAVPDHVIIVKISD